MVKYLNSKLIKYVLNSCRWSGAASKVVFEQIPMLSLDSEWTDEQLFDYFNLTKEERELVINYDKKNN